MALQQSGPMIVQLAPKPSPQTNFADVLIGAFGITGVLVLIALVLGGVVALVLVQWHKRHRPEEDHAPSITS